MALAIPRFCALNGGPNSGKSTLAEAMRIHFGIVPIDDGLPLRNACKELYGLSDWHVGTQEGKKSLVEVCGEIVQVRDLLGKLRLDLQNRHGPGFIPWAAMRLARITTGDETTPCSFGSVRGRQGHYYKEAGGIVIEVRRPGFEPINDFDQYDRTLVDLTIDNTYASAGQFIEAALQQLRETFHPETFHIGAPADECESSGPLSERPTEAKVRR